MQSERVRTETPASSTYPYVSTYTLASQYDCEEYSPALLSLAEKISNLESEIALLSGQYGTRRQEALKRLNMYIVHQIEESQRAESWQWFTHLLSAKDRIAHMDIAAVGSQRESAQPSGFSMGEFNSSSSSRAEFQDTTVTVAREDLQNQKRLGRRLPNPMAPHGDVDPESKKTTVPSQSRSFIQSRTDSRDRSEFQQTCRPAVDHEDGDDDDSLLMPIPNYGIPNSVSHSASRNANVTLAGNPSGPGSSFTLASRAKLSRSVPQIQTREIPSIVPSDVPNVAPRVAPIQNPNDVKNLEPSDSQSASTSTSASSSAQVHKRKCDEAFHSVEFVEGPRIIVSSPWIGEEKEPDMKELENQTFSQMALQQLWSYTFDEIHWKNIDERKILEALGPIISGERFDKLLQTPLTHWTNFMTEFFLDLDSPNDSPSNMQDWHERFGLSSFDLDCVRKNNWVHALHFFTDSVDDSTTNLHRSQSYGTQRLEFRLGQNARIVQLPKEADSKRGEYRTEIFSWLPRLHTWPEKYLNQEFGRNFYITLGIMLMECCRNQVRPCVVRCTNRVSLLDRYFYEIRTQPRRLPILVPSGAFLSLFLIRHNIQGVLTHVEHGNILFVLRPNKYTEFQKSTPLDKDDKREFKLLYIVLMYLYLYGPHASKNRSLDTFLNEKIYPKILRPYLEKVHLRLEEGFHHHIITTRRGWSVHLPWFRIDRISHNIRARFLDMFRDGKLAFLSCTEEELVQCMQSSPLEWNKDRLIADLDRRNF